MKNLAIFASGSGTNAENIIIYSQLSKLFCVKLILSNKYDAGVIDRAKKYNVPVLVFDKKMFYESNEVINILKKNSIDFIILAGFLWLVPASLIKEFNEKIINIHPALLPKYGGKGMFGMNVHNAVIQNDEKMSGITIHYIDEVYDRGKYILQVCIKVEDNDTPDSLANKIHQLEYYYFPKAIEFEVLKSL
jgi:phosphoribosylglycinamide formyltransferase-1